MQKVKKLSPRIQYDLCYIDIMEKEIVHGFKGIYFTISDLCLKAIREVYDIRM